MKRTRCKSLPLVSVLVFATVAAVGLTTSPDALAAAKVASSNPLSGADQAIQEGKVLYRSVCVVCHGMRANGRGRGIAGASNLQKFKRGYSLYVEIVKKGKKKMPPYGGGRVLSDAAKIRNACTTRRKSVRALPDQEWLASPRLLPPHREREQQGFPLIGAKQISVIHASASLSERARS